MATAMTPTQEQAQLRKWLGARLKLYPGWQTRGYGPGSISDPQGVLIHHTGGEGQSDDYLNFLANVGRPGDVPPPLCNFSTDRDGDFWLIANERANHAGMGSLTTLNHMKAKDYGWSSVELKPGPDNVNGNTHLYGNELRYDGSHAPSTEMWVSAVLGAVAVCDFYGWGAHRVIGHKEWTSRKNDPGHVAMYLFRRDVDAALKAGPGNWPAREEDDMAGEGATIIQLLKTKEAADAARYKDIRNTLTVWMQTKDDQRSAADKARDDALAAEVNNLETQVQDLIKKLAP
jgi:hypothetical protein